MECFMDVAIKRGKSTSKELVNVEKRKHNENKEGK